MQVILPCADYLGYMSSTPSPRTSQILTTVTYASQNFILHRSITTQ